MEGFDLFAFLAGASPWWWLALAGAIFVFEMTTFTYYLIWIALAALALAGIVWAAPGTSGQTQIALFAVFSIVSTVAGRYALPFFRSGEAGGAALNRRADRLIGRTGAALDDFGQDGGEVMVDDIRWRARLTDGAARKGDPLRIVGADGMQLICESPAPKPEL